MSLNGTRLNHKGERTTESETLSSHPSFLTLWPAPLLWARFLTSEPEIALINLSAVLLASVGKEPACNAEDPSSISGSGRSAGEGIGYSLQYSGLENSMDCIVHGVTKSQTPLRNFHFHLLGAYSGAGTLYAASPALTTSEVGIGSSFYG